MAKKTPPVHLTLSLFGNAKEALDFELLLQIGHKAASDIEH